MSVPNWTETNRAKWVGIRPGHYGEQVLNLAEAVNNTVVIYTVPVGKLFYLDWYDFLVTSNLVGAGSMYIHSGAFAVVYLAYARTISSAGIMTDKSCSMFHPIKLIEGYSVKITSNVANYSIIGSIHGWVESI